MKKNLLYILTQVMSSIGMINMINYILKILPALLPGARDGKRRGRYGIRSISSVIQTATNIEFYNFKSNSIFNFCNNQQ